MKDLPIDHPPVRGMKNGLISEEAGFRRRDAARWSVAALVVLTVHGAGAYALHSAHVHHQPEGEPPAAIMLELDPVAQAPEAAQDSAIPSAETSPHPDQAEYEPQPQAEHAESKEPVIEEPQELAAADPAEEVPEVIEAPKPEIVLPKVAEKPKNEKKPEPKPEKPKHKPRHREKAGKTQKAAETQAASAPQINAQNSSRMAASLNRQSNASAGISPAKWQSKVQAHLERKKRTAQRRLGRADKGIVQIAFVIDAGGNVISARISGTSGNPQVDQAALSAVKAASPVPAPPPSMAASRIPFQVPFKFN